MQNLAQSDPAEGSREVVERELARRAPRITGNPVAKTGMLIRRPAAEVFEAIINPEITSKFWFSEASGKLEASRTVTWSWEDHDVSIDVKALEVEPLERVLIEWPGYTNQTQVEWTFRAVGNGATFVSVRESGWIEQEGDKLVRYVADSTQGFTLMLAGMKALLEHGIRLNLTADRYPKGVEEQVIGE